MKKIIRIAVCILLAFESIPVFAGDFSDYIQVYKLVSDEKSQYEYKWIDENGNEVVLEGVSSKDNISRKKAVLPSRYSSTELGYVTSVKNQGNSSSCWAFATVSAAESYLLRKSEPLPENQSQFNFSEAHHVWFAHRSLADDPNDPTSGDGLSVESPYNKGGNWLHSAFSLARGTGFAFDTDYPFYPYSLSSMGNYGESERYISEYRLTDSSRIVDNDTQTVKEKIMSNGSVSASFYSSSDYLTTTSGNYCYYCPLETSTNHMVSIVGWDDNYEVSNFKKTTPDSKGAWIIKNSWGTSWGNGGYFYLSYCDKSISYFNAVELKKNDKSETIHQYDGYGYGMSFSLGGDINPVTSIKYGNVFTAEKNESINSVAFYTLGENIEYTVDIYRSLPSDYNNPVDDGKHVLSQSGTFALNGYHTVDLDKSVLVRQGSIFSVVITVSSSEKVSVPAEGASGSTFVGAEEYYSSSLRQSYYTAVGSGKWYDSCQKGYNNLCVKAFASEAEIQDFGVPDNTEISTAGQLVEFADHVNNGWDYEDKTVTLVSDIDMSGIDFTPVGTQEHPFEGTFDGNGKVIENLTISKPNENNVGLFGYTGEYSEILYVGLENITVTGNNNVGALVGKSLSNRIYNCYSGNGQIKGKEYVGGLIGYNCSTLTGSSFAFSASQGTKNKVGGFAGYSDSTYDNCFARGTRVSSNFATVNGVSIASNDRFGNGYVAYNLKSSKYTWTKGENHPLLSANEIDTVYKVSVSVKTNTTTIYTMYFAGSEDPKQTLSRIYEDYFCSFYTDTRFKTEFSGYFTADSQQIAVKCVNKTVMLEDGSDYLITDGILLGISQGKTVCEVLNRLRNKEYISVKKANGQEASQNEIVGTGYSFLIKNSSGTVLDEVKVSICGDLNSDGYVDLFDLAVAGEYVNSFTEPEYAAFMKAIDIYEDGYIDATDIAFLIYVANFEV